MVRGRGGNIQYILHLPSHGSIHLSPPSLAQLGSPHGEAEGWKEKGLDCIKFLPRCQFISYFLDDLLLQGCHLGFHITRQQVLLGAIP
ncbi:hypothetical protein TNCV_2846811 [Trichonephila clavipes]|nr:hypothetical protein TNCV_2846811 [Trichonephila clavipes]